MSFTISARCVPDIGQVAPPVAAEWNNQRGQRGVHGWSTGPRFRLGKKLRSTSYLGRMELGRSHRCTPVKDPV